MDLECEGGNSVPSLAEAWEEAEVQSGLEELLREQPGYEPECVGVVFRREDCAGPAPNPGRSGYRPGGLRRFGLGTAQADAKAIRGHHCGLRRRRLVGCAAQRQERSLQPAGGGSGDCRRNGRAESDVRYWSPLCALQTGFERTGEVELPGGPGSDEE